jgi:hypothetical protein
VVSSENLLVADADAPDLGSISGLHREMGLSKRELQTLAAAYVYEEDDAEEERAGG